MKKSASVVLAFLFFLSPARANQSEGSPSQTDTAATSRNATQSSSDQSTQNTSDQSSQNSSDQTTGSTSQGSSDSTSDESGSNPGVSIAISSIVLTGLSSAGTTIGIVMTVKRNRQAMIQLERYLAQNHALLLCDLTADGGISFQDWASQLKLTMPELEKLRKDFEGSSEQKAMLSSLEGRITPAAAGRFAEAFVILLTRSLPSERSQSILIAAVQ